MASSLCLSLYYLFPCLWLPRSIAAAFDFHFHFSVQQFSVLFFIVYFGEYRAFDMQVLYA